MFVDVQLTVDFDERGLRGIQHQWALDEMFSMAVFSAHDRNKNGKLDPEEAKTIRAEAFDNLENFKWFTHILDGVDPSFTEAPQNFSAKWDGIRLHYNFYLPLLKTASKDDRYLILAIFDPTAFVSLTPALEKAVIRKPKNLEVDNFVDTINDLKPFAGLVHKHDGLYIRFRNPK